MTQFLRDEGSDSEEVLTPLMLDGTYLSRNFATLGPFLTLQPPCLVASCHSHGPPSLSTLLWTRRRRRRVGVREARVNDPRADERRRVREESGGARVVHSAARLVVSRLSLTPLAQASGRNEWKARDETTRR